MTPRPSISVLETPHDSTRECTGTVHFATGQVSRIFHGKNAYNLAYQWARDRRELGDPECAMRAAMVRAAKPLLFRPDRDEPDRLVARTGTAIATVNPSPAEIGWTVGLWQWTVRRIDDGKQIAGGFDATEDTARRACEWFAVP